MKGAFYRLIDDHEVPGRWFLGRPRDGMGDEVDPRLFLAGTPVDLCVPLEISLRRPGRELDFTLGDFDMPVIRRKVGERIRHIAADEIQLIPTVIEGSEKEYVVLQATQDLACLDESEGHVVLNDEADIRGGRPRYKMVIGPKVIRRLAEGRHVFRIEGWRIALMVSGDVAEILDGILGVAVENNTRVAPTPRVARLRRTPARAVGPLVRR